MKINNTFLESYYGEKRKISPFSTKSCPIVAVASLLKTHMLHPRTYLSIWKYSMKIYLLPFFCKGSLFRIFFYLFPLLLCVSPNGFQCSARQFWNPPQRLGVFGQKKWSLVKRGGTAAPTQWKMEKIIKKRRGRAGEFLLRRAAVARGLARAMATIVSCYFPLLEIESWSQFDPLELIWKNHEKELWNFSQGLAHKRSEDVLPMRLTVGKVNLAHRGAKYQWD